MGGGIRNTVKCYTKGAKRLALAVDDHIVHHENETMNSNMTAPQAAADCLGKNPQNPLPTKLLDTAYPAEMECCFLPRYGLNSNSKVSSVSVPSTPWTEVDNLKSFCFHELEKATRNFGPDSFLGEGGFGRVFKGWVDEHSLTATKPGAGMAVAIRRLFSESRMLQNDMEWLLLDLYTEVNSLGQLGHSNLVKLIGYCLEDDRRLLVYEFMSCGSLDSHLFRRSSYFQPLSWNLRMKIALGAAKALAFLHSDEAKVVYGDFKTSKILLDSSYCAKLSGYGLGNEGLQGYRSHFSEVGAHATYGYAAPEYKATASLSDLDIMDGLYSHALEDHRHGKAYLTPKSDVYSFGVVLLEMLTSRRAVDENGPPWERHFIQCNLVEWARPYLASKHKALQILDARLEGQYTSQGALRAVSIASLCLQREAMSRPNMNVVVEALEQLQSGDKEGLGISQNETLPNPHTS